MTTAEPRTLVMVAAAWALAGLNLGLLFDLKATLTTLVLLIVLNGLVLAPAHGALVAVGLVASGFVFAAFIVHPLAALAVLSLVIFGLAEWCLRVTALNDRRRALMLTCGVAAVIWPAFLGLVSNSVVEVACPDGGIEVPCHGFYRVGTS